ncbi:hypothetical protein D3C81_1802250 [compost metagenome]
MLAGHHRDIADVVGGSTGDIAGGEHVLKTLHFEIAVDVQTPLAIAFGIELFGQWTGAETHGPDHGIALDVATVGEGDAVGIHGGDRGVDDPLDAQFF